MGRIDFGQQRPQAAPINQLHDNKWLTVCFISIMDGDNVNVVEAGRGLSLGQQAGTAHGIQI